MKSGDRGRRLPLFAWVGLLLVSLLPLRAQVEGMQRWAYSIPNGGYIRSSPAVDHEGTVYVGFTLPTKPVRGGMIAVRRDGSPKWVSPLVNGDVASSPAIANGRIYFGAWDGKFYALSAETGAKVWEFDVDVAKPPAAQSISAGIIESSPAIGSDGTIYFGSADLLRPEFSALHALSPEGRELWRKYVGGDVDSSPAIAPDGTIYFGSYDRKVYALRPDGSEKWSVETDDKIFSSPAVGKDGTIYIGSTLSVYAISAEGGIRWKFQIGNRVIATPSLGPDGTIYVGSIDGVFYAVNPLDGSQKWQFFVGQPVSSSAAVRGDGTVIFGSDEEELGGGRVRGVLYALNSESASNRVKWRYVTGDKIWSSPVVDQEGNIYVGSYDGKLHAVQGNGSPSSAVSSWPMFRQNPAQSGRVPSPLTGGQLVNLSTRAKIGPGSNLIGGFAAAGTATKYYLIRAIGPTLVDYGVGDPLIDPSLSLFPLGSPIRRAFNDDWNLQANREGPVETAAEGVGAFLLPTGSKDAAVLPLLGPGLYTATVGGASAVSGTALIEIYDAGFLSPETRLTNLSTLGPVSANAPLIPGLVIRGNQPARLLIRAAGPSLNQFGVAGFLARPRMEVFAQPNQAANLTSAAVRIHSNTGWTTDLSRMDLVGAAVMTGAFPFVENSADSAALLTLEPGQYSIHVTGADGGTGQVLVEVYLFP